MQLSVKHPSVSFFSGMAVCFYSFVVLYHCIEWQRWKITFYELSAIKFRCFFHSDAEKKFHQIALSWISSSTWRWGVKIKLDCCSSVERSKTEFWLISLMCSLEIIMRNDEKNAHNVLASPWKKPEFNSSQNKFQFKISYVAWIAHKTICGRSRGLT